MAAIDCTLLIQSTRKRLELLHRELLVMQAGVACAALALRQQHCEQDAEVACMLDHYVGAGLSRQLEPGVPWPDDLWLWQHTEASVGSPGQISHPQSNGDERGAQIPESAH